MLTFLTKPYPLSDAAGKQVRTAFLFSVFIFLFLYTFKPFGLGNPAIEPGPLQICLGYALVTFVILLLNAFLLPVIFKSTYVESRWRVYNEILEVLWYFFSVGTGNFIYTAMLWNSELSVGGFLLLQFFTLITGAIPVTVLILIKQIRWLKKYADQAHQMSKNLSEIPVNTNHRNSALAESDVVKLIADNGKDTFQSLSQNLIFIQAAGNYIEVYHEKDNALKKILLRCSLKRTQKMLNGHKDFFRCHRMYIINIKAIESVSGTSQGLRLQLRKATEPIPVSRTLDSELSQRITELASAAAIH